MRLTEYALAIVMAFTVGTGVLAVKAKGCADSNACPPTEKAAIIKSFQRGDVRFYGGGAPDYDVLDAKVCDKEYLIEDGCSPTRSTVMCLINDKPDICTVKEHGKLKLEEHGHENAEPVCGDMYRKIRDDYIKYHIARFKRIVQGKERKIETQKNGPAKKYVVRTDNICYVVGDEDGDGITDLFACIYSPETDSTPLSIQKNKSEQVEGLIEDLVEFIEQNM